MTGALCALVGVGRDLVVMPSLNLSAVAVSPTAASVSFQLNSTGLYAGIEQSVANYNGSWVNPNANASLYECFATLNSGALTTGTTGAWLPLNVNQSWSRDRTAVGISAANITIQIRLIATGFVAATGTIDLNAEVTL